MTKIVSHFHSNLFFPLVLLAVIISPSPQKSHNKQIYKTNERREKGEERERECVCVFVLRKILLRPLQIFFSIYWIPPNLYYCKMDSYKVLELYQEVLFDLFNLSTLHAHLNFFVAFISYSDLWFSLWSSRSSLHTSVQTTGLLLTYYY